MLATKNYTAKIDAKKRITLRGAKHSFYKVKEYENGCIILEPQELVTPVEISIKTLKDMDEMIENYKLGKVSEAIDLSIFGEK